MASTPYSIPERRPLTEEERLLLRRILAESHPDRLAEVEKLEVYARCGCGKCPTVLFEAAPDETKGGGHLIGDYQGGSAETGLIGVMLWERKGRLAELEAWSIDGTDCSKWPTLESLRPLEISRD